MATRKATPTITCVAGPPFNKATADIILRSADGVDFHVRRSILAESSPVFEDMLSIPQPPATSSDAASPPVVTLTETARTLDALLRFCYPVDDPELGTADDALRVLDAARKYMMDHALRGAQRHFAVHAQREPLRMYALACARGWSDEMRVAARASLAAPLDVRAVPELDAISAGAYLRLQAYHRACRKAAAALHYYGVAEADAGAPRHLCFAKKSRKGVGVHVEPWWTEYMERAREALLVRPCGSTVLIPELSYKFLVDIVAKLPMYDRTRVLFDLGQFNVEYAQSIDRAISEVQLEVKTP